MEKARSPEMMVRNQLGPGIYEWEFWKRGITKDGFGKLRFGNHGFRNGMRDGSVRFASGGLGKMRIRDLMLWSKV